MKKLIEITGKALAGEWGVDDEDGTGIPVLRTTNFTNHGVVSYKDVVTRKIKKKNIQEKYLVEGDIIIEKSGGSDKQPVGRVIYFDGPDNTYLFNNFTGLLRVKDKEKWSPKYVFYSLFANYSRGGTRKFENRTTGLHNLQTDRYVSEFVVHKKEIDEQRKICEVLDKTKAIIDLKKQQLLELDDLIKSRFVEMFGDPNLNPYNWEKVKIGDATSMVPQNGLYKPMSDYVNNGSGVPILRIDAFYSGKVTDFSSLKRLNCSSSELEKYLLFENDIVINRVNSIEYLGKCAHICDLIEDTVFESNMMRFHMDDGKFNATYVTYLLCSDYIYAQILSHAKKAVNQASINQKDVQDFDIFVPPLDIQNKFTTFVQQVDKLKVEVQKSLDETQELFDSLMQLYFKSI